MKIFHTLTLIAALSLGTAALANAKTQDSNKMPATAMGDSMSMQDQDYSAWKDYFFGFRRGSMWSMYSNSMMKPKFEGRYDEKVFKYLKRVFWANETQPARLYDFPMVPLNDDAKWVEYEKLANIYRRELIHEDMAMGMMSNGMSSSSSMSKGM